MAYFPNEKESIGAHFARFMCALAKNEDPLLLLAARLAADAVQSGHVCADLALVQHFGLLDDIDREAAPSDVEAWVKTLGAANVVGAPADHRPLILDKTRLYLQGYWRYKQTLSGMLSGRALRWFPPADAVRFAKLLRRYFPKPDDQSVACCIAGMKNFLVLTGGPGTGKTTAIAKIAAFLLDSGNAGQGRIALTAPTGKAAARLMQSMRHACESAAFPRKFKTPFPGRPLPFTGYWALPVIFPQVNTLRTTPCPMTWLSWTKRQWPTWRC